MLVAGLAVSTPASAQGQGLGECAWPGCTVGGGSGTTIQVNGVDVDGANFITGVDGVISVDTVPDPDEITVDLSACRSQWFLQTLRRTIVEPDYVFPVGHLHQNAAQSMAVEFNNIKFPQDFTLRAFFVGQPSPSTSRECEFNLIYNLSTTETVLGTGTTIAATIFTHGDSDTNGNTGCIPDVEFMSTGGHCRKVITPVLIPQGGTMTIEIDEPDTPGGGGDNCGNVDSMVVGVLGCFAPPE